MEVVPPAWVSADGAQTQQIQNQVQELLTRIRQYLEAPLINPRLVIREKHLAPELLADLIKLTDQYIILRQYVQESIWSDTFHQLNHVWERLHQRADQGPPQLIDPSVRRVVDDDGVWRRDVPLDELTARVLQGDRTKALMKAFGVSRNTITRRLKEIGMRKQDIKSRLDDEEIMRRMREVKSAGFQNIGNQRMHGMLRANGVHVTHSRVRAGMKVVDPTRARTQMAKALYRRVYHVEYPRSLWHIDGKC